MYTYIVEISMQNIRLHEKKNIRQHMNESIYHTLNLILNLNLYLFMLLFFLLQELRRRRGDNQSFFIDRK